MKALTQTIQGELLLSDEHGVLIIDPMRENVLLRFAFTRYGGEAVIFPELLLDDWGHERKSLGLYRWIHENGFRFPRAELFGYNDQGRNQQCFLRELDLQSKYPCVGFKDFETPLADGIKVCSFVIVKEETIHAERTKDIRAFPWPMRNAAVDWWRADAAGATELAESLLLDHKRHHP